MIASGVSTLKAKIMYGAVYAFGPRWAEGAAPGQFSQEAFDALRSYIEKRNPSLTEIETTADTIITGDMSPVLKDVQSGGDININIGR